MISHLKLRLAASLLTMAAVLQPHSACAQTVVVPHAHQQTMTVTLPHISITAIGRGSPVVLIPGLGTPRQVWAEVAPEIARSHRVILVQVNGFGGDDPGQNLHPGLLDGIVADLSGYLAAQHLGPADVIGHSMGGLVALMMARAHPDAVRRVMVVDALPFFGVLAARGGEASVETVRPLATAMRDSVAARWGRPVDPATAAADVASLALKPESRTRMAAWAAAADPRVTAEGLYEDMTTDLRADLPHLSVPITVVYAWSDSNFSHRAEAFYRVQYAGTPHLTLIPVGESGHFVMLDQPAAFAAAVRTFLN